VRAEGRKLATAKEFVEFWLENSVHPDEQFGRKQDGVAVERLVEGLLVAAEAQGFSKKQMEDELGGDIHSYIRNSIDSQNADERARLEKEGH